MTPQTFDLWARILRETAHGVLWLYADNETAAANLKQEAVQRRVAGQLVVLHEMAQQPEYLARYRLADLFLDSFPYNAGATASDALWAGLPVLTCLGESFASRMAASLLTSVGLGELIAAKPDDYAALAVALATSPQRLTRLKETLARQRDTAALFDIERFTRTLETGYAAMHERQLSGLAPDHIFVSPALGA
ncbi:MAG TPA: hypothetical protein VI113_01215 [Alphaproteobacteria bacterium]